MSEPKRTYYSRRTGLLDEASLRLEGLRRLFGRVYSLLEREGYLQEALGYYCIDAPDWEPGTLGTDIALDVFNRTGKEGLWPIDEHIETYTEDDVFDMLEVVFDLVSAPDKSRVHTYGQCGHFFGPFDQNAGQEFFVGKVNPILLRYGSGFELSASGVVQAIAPVGLDRLLEQPIPEIPGQNTKSRLEDAIRKFRRRNASEGEKRDAVRDLSDLLEYIRPQLKLLIPAGDEADLFNIANNYTIRHFRDSQRGDYDRDIWLTWMFYTYANMLHVATRLIARANSG